MGVHLKAVDRRWMDLNPMVVARQWIDDDSRAVSAKWTGDSLMIFAYNRQIETRGPKVLTLVGEILLGTRDRLRVYLLWRRVLYYI